MHRRQIPDRDVEVAAVIREVGLRLLPIAGIGLEDGHEPRGEREVAGDHRRHRALPRPFAQLASLGEAVVDAAGAPQRAGGLAGAGHQVVPGDGVAGIDREERLPVALRRFAQLDGLAQVEVVDRGVGQADVDQRAGAHGLHVAGPLLQDPAGDGRRLLAASPASSARPVASSTSTCQAETSVYAAAAGRLAERQVVDAGERDARQFERLDGLLLLVVAQLPEAEVGSPRCRRRGAARPTPPPQRSSAGGCRRLEGDLPRLEKIVLAVEHARARAAAPARGRWR